MGVDIGFSGQRGAGEGGRGSRSINIISSNAISSFYSDVISPISLCSRNYYGLATK